MRLSLVLLLSAWIFPLTQAQAQSVPVPLPELPLTQSVSVPLPELPSTQSIPVPLLGAEAPASVLRFTGEYLTWFIREGHIPAILTTSPTASQGILGQPDTRVLYGDQRLETRHADTFAGARVGADWMDGSGDYGLEGRAFFLERDSTYYKAYSADGSQLLALSYIDPATGQQASRIVSGLDPQRGLLSGGFVGYSRIEWYGEEANVVLPFACGETWQVDFLAGTRFLQMRDRYETTATSRSLPDNETLYGLTDNYRTSDAFYGAQIGARGEAHYGRFFVQMRGTISLGADAERIQTFGQSIYQTPTVRIATPVGLLIGPNNTADVSRAAVDGVGEVGVNVGYQLTRRLRVLAGYTFIGWLDPIRAGNQVDPVANSPGFAFKGEALWVQGVNVGLEARW